MLQQPRFLRRGEEFAGETFFVVVLGGDRLDHTAGEGPRQVTDQALFGTQLEIHRLFSLLRGRVGWRSAMIAQACHPGNNRREIGHKDLKVRRLAG